MKIPEFTSPEFHPKGWGYELWLVNGEKYCGKILHFFRYKRCSFHYHKLKAEHFYCASGKFLLKLSWDDDIDNAAEGILEKGQVVEIPIGLRHQMVCLEEGELIEISTQHIEDDSYRVAPGDSQK